jgi:hypothetical protein
MRWGTGKFHNTAIRRAALVSGAALLACAGTGQAAAQEWKLSTYISQQVLYSDNLLLSNSREISTVGFITAPGFKVERNSPTSTVVFDGRFEFAEYVDHSNFNSQDQFLDLAVENNLSDRARLGLSANFTHDTTLKSDLDENDEFLDDSFDFISWRVGPSFTYLLSPIDQMVLSSSYRSVSYDTNEKVDYQYFGPTLEYGRALDELRRVTVSLSANRYIPEESGDDYTDTLGLLFGYTYTPSERFTITGAAGVAYIREEEDDPGSADNDSTDIGYRLRFNTRYELSDQTVFRFALSHDTEPSGNGSTGTRNRVGGSIRHLVTPLTALGLNVDYSDNVDFLGVEGESTEDDDETRYLSVRPSVTWTLTEDWSLVGEYRYRHKVDEDDNQSASSNTVYLTVQYNFPTVAGEGP